MATIDTSNGDPTAASNRPSGATIWVISELYYPEETSTGYYMTGIAESLARHSPVRVLCAQPTYSQRGNRALRREVRRGVSIRRLWSTTLSNQTTRGRLANLVTLTSSVFLRVLFELRRGDRVLVESTPPTLPFAVGIACVLRRIRFVALVQDTYPEVLVAAGMIRESSALAGVLDRANRLLYRFADRVVVLGRGMADRARERLPTHEASKVRVIRSWGDIDLITPQPRAGSAFLAELGIDDKFVLQFAGNISRLNDIENLVECMELLRRDTGIHFLFVGRGGRRVRLESEVERRALENVTIADWLPRSQTAEMHRACDAVLIPLLPGMGGVAVPSRVYNSLASGRPIVAVTEAHSELARIVIEERVGWLVPPGDPAALAGAVRAAAADSDGRASMGARARAAAEARFSRARITDSWVDLFRDLDRTARLAGGATSDDGE